MPPEVPTMTCTRSRVGDTWCVLCVHAARGSYHDMHPVTCGQCLACTVIPQSVCPAASTMVTCGRAEGGTLGLLPCVHTPVERGGTDCGGLGSSTRTPTIECGRMLLRDVTPGPRAGSAVSGSIPGPAPHPRHHQEWTPGHPGNLKRKSKPRIPVRTRK